MPAIATVRPFVTQLRTPRGQVLAVGEPGGEALANTAWSVLTKGGDTVKESIGAFPKVILAEGDYQIVARNEGKTYERSLKVINGVDGEIEVLAR